MANNDSKNTRAGPQAQIYAYPAELVARLDREIEELQRVAPPTYQRAIEDLRAVMLVVHEAIDGNGPAGSLSDP